MFSQFKQHIEKFVPVSEAEFSEISAFFTTVQYKKKENLLEEGHVCKSNYFVLKGCLRKFFINEKGVEQTTEFAIENWWMSDSLFLETQLISQFYIQTVENSELLVISRESQDQLLNKHPIMEKYFRCIYQKAYAAMQMRIKFIYGFSREELYHHFRTSQPQFLQRIPQYLLASYLNFTPEYLSEIRKKSVS